MRMEKAKPEKLYTAHKQEGLLLNANESPLNLPDYLLDDFSELIPALLFNRYPVDGSPDLREVYAAVQKNGLTPEMVIAGNGSDQMLQLLITAFVSQGDTLLTISPDFGMYDFYADAMGGRVERFDLFGEDGANLQTDRKITGWDTDAFIQKAKEVRPSLILFSNPNNPTGLMLRAEEVLKIARALPEIPVVSDEAYMEFGGDSVLPYLNEQKNLYITRTLSKAYGLAGVRVGFLLSNASNIEAIDPKRPVYNLGTISSAIAARVLQEQDLFEMRIQDVIEQREQLEKELEKLDHFSFIPSAANFILVSGRPEAIQKALAAFDRENIAIREYPDRNYMRITVGLEEQNERVLEVLRSVDQELEHEAAGGKAEGKEPA